MTQKRKELKSCVTSPLEITNLIDHLPRLTMYLGSKGEQDNFLNLKKFTDTGDRERQGERGITMRSDKSLGR